MNRILRVSLKILGYGALTAVALAAIWLAYVFIAYPRKEAPSTETIERTPARLARGEYLVNHVASCLLCHSERNWHIYSAPVDPATKGQGTFVTLFRPHANSANITPFGIGDWSDGEVIRAMTAGVKKDGSPVNMLMSFDTYARMGEEDVKSVVAYLRTLKPIERPQPPNEQSFSDTLETRFLPKPWKPRPVPSRADEVEYGRYLVEIAECGVCHFESGEGGFPFRLPGAADDVRVVSSNISPDRETGIGTWNRARFIGRFKAYDSEEGRRIPVTDPSQNTVMPWVQYAGLTEEDLGAIYEYLHTLPPVKTEIPVPAPSGAPTTP